MTHTELKPRKSEGNYDFADFLVDSMNAAKDYEAKTGDPIARIYMQNVLAAWAAWNQLK